MMADFVDSTGVLLIAPWRTFCILSFSSIIPTIMSLNFLFEDSKGNIADENGQDPMEVIENTEDGINLENLTNLSSYIKWQEQSSMMDLEPQQKGDGEQQQEQQQQEQQQQPKS